MKLSKVFQFLKVSLPIFAGLLLLPESASAQKLKIRADRFRMKFKSTQTDNIKPFTLPPIQMIYSYSIEFFSEKSRTGECTFLDEEYGEDILWEKDPAQITFQALQDSLEAFLEKRKDSLKKIYFTLDTDLLAQDPLVLTVDGLSLEEAALRNY